MQCFALCTVSSVIATCTEKVISLFQIKTNYEIDWFLDIEVENVKKIAIFQNYVAYVTSNRDVCLLKFQIKHEDTRDSCPSLSSLVVVEDPLRQMNVNDTLANYLSVCQKYFEKVSSSAIEEKEKENAGPQVEEDEHFVECVFDSSGDTIPCIDLMLNNPQLQELRASAVAKSTKQSSTREVFRPIKDVHIVKVNTEANYKLCYTVVLFYRELPQGDDVCSLSLLPEFDDSPDNNTQENVSYLRNDSDNKERTEGVFWSRVTGLRFFFATSRQGFLYNVCDQVKLITTYTFTGDVIECMASSSFLYTITENGLEIFAMRTTQMSEGLGAMSPYLIGIQPLSDLKSVKANDDNSHLILLSKTTDSALRKRMAKKIDVPKTKMGSPSKETESEETVGWNVYVLKHNSLSKIFQEIVNKAETYRGNNTVVEHQLLAEAHLLLQSRMLSLCGFQQQTSDREECRALLKHSFGLLAQMYMQVDDFLSAAKLFTQSDISPSEVVQRLFKKVEQFEQEGTATSNNESPKIEREAETISPFGSLRFSYFEKKEKLNNAILFFLDSVLFNPQTAQVFSKIDTSLADNIVRHYYRQNLTRLGKVILETPLTAYTLNSTIEMLEKVSKDENESVVALIVLYLRSQQRAKASTLLERVPSEFIVDYCCCNPSLLDTTKNGDFVRLLRERKPFDLLEILTRFQTKKKNGASMNNENKLTCRDAISLLDNRTNQQQKEDLHINRLLTMCFLEYILLEREGQPEFLSHNRSDQTESKNETSELFEQLTTRYIDVLCLPQDERTALCTLLSQQIQVTSLPPTVILPPQQQTRRQDLIYEEIWKKFHLSSFLSHRYKWLDSFGNESQNTKPRNLSSETLFSSPAHSVVADNVLYTKKMEGLLCSVLPRDNEKISRLLEQKLTDIHYKQVLYLCYAVTNRLSLAIEQILLLRPSVLLDYAKQFCTTVDHWRIVLNTLVQIILQQQSTTTQPSQLAQREYEYIRLYESLIEHTATVFSPSDFLTLLPEHGNLKFFLPYIERCFRNHYANELILKIRKKATNHLQ